MVKKKLSKILVPLDNSANSKRGLNYALYLAEKTGASITGVYVISYQGLAGKIVGPYKGTVLKHVNSFLEKAKKTTEKRNIKFTHKVLYGSPAQTLLEFAKQNKVDLIVIGRRGEGSSNMKFPGSVSNGLFQQSNIPLLVVD